MAYSIAKEALLAGYLNTYLITPKKEEIFVTLDDLAKYGKLLWNAGIGPVQWGEFDLPDLKFYLDYLAEKRLCRSYFDGHYWFSLDTFPPDQESLEYFKSTLVARRVTLVIKLKVRINECHPPYLLMSFMGFGCFYEIK